MDKAALVLAAFLFGGLAAQPLQIGTISIPVSVTCPTGFYSGMTCNQAIITCPNADDIQVTYGYRTPANAKGTIVLHAGSGGTLPFGTSGGQSYADKYFKAKYRIVLLAWASDWEQATASGPQSIKVAACRPATFLRFAYDSIHGGITATGGMCAHGQSGGSAAWAYSLVWYGSSSYLDNVLLTSGPVFGDIEAGCKVPNAQPVTVCPTGQLGCNGAPWTANPQYMGGPGSGMTAWTGGPCNAGEETSPESNSAWKAMSIVDGTSGANFYFPQTTIAAYLCANTAPASAQGQFFYSQFTYSWQTASFSVNRVDACTQSENVWTGTVSGGGNAYDASAAAMTGGCFKRH